MQKHRIYTNIGRDQKINVEIKQDFDLMEILSLKFTQKDIFASGNCSEYGVVVGRISANNGYGIPNARVSIFIPEEDLDENDPVIHALYPYKGITDRNDENYRYNLLPKRQQHPGHSPTGTFFDQQDILTREEVLEVFEKYYSYTVKTNTAGDFMIWGVPVGTQILHIDIDLSDIGCFSLRPNDFLNKGYGIEQFESYYKFKSGSDIDSLPQIVTFDKTIDVYPFWGNEELCEIGITRSDFDISERDIKIEPVAIILFSSVTDETSHAVKRNGRIKRNSGYKCNLQTSEGKIEVVRFTGKSVFGSDGVTEYPELEYFNPTETINEDGVAMVAFPMNIDYVFTNELGEQEITNDSNKGIPTSAVARFRFGLDFQSNKVTTAKYLVPNIREFSASTNGRTLGFADKSDYEESLLATYQFSDVFEDYITITPPITGVTIFNDHYDEIVKEHKKDLILTSNTVTGTTAPQDYFYKFVYGKVYAVSSFQGTHVESPLDGRIPIRDAFLGIKEIRPNVESDCASSANYFPTNFAFKNRIKFNVIISQVLLFLQYLFSIITIRFAEILGAIAYDVGRGMQGIRLFTRIGQRFEDLAYRTQERYTKQLPLTIYPDCEECTSDSEALTEEGVNFENACRRAEVGLRLGDLGRHHNVTFYIFNSEQGIYFSNSSAPGSTLLDDMYPGESAAQDQGGCTGLSGVTYNTSSSNTIPLANLDNVLLADGTQKYGIEIICSGSTIVFDTFADYLQPDTPEMRSLNFEAGTYDGFGALFISIHWDYWLELTGMNLEIEEERNLLYANPSLVRAVARIYDRSSSLEGLSPLSGTTMSIETGCEKYDKLYDESITLRYIWSSGSTLPYNSLVPVSPNNDQYLYDAGFGEWTEITHVDTHPYLISTISGTNSTKRMPVEEHFELRRRRRHIGIQRYNRKTKSGLTELRDGLFTIIPVIQGPTKNLKVLREWYRRKRVGLSFCGGVVNYSFIDNWLHGMLYFFKFDKRIRWDTEANYDLNQRGSKYPRELVFYNIFDKNFYYRSTPYLFENGVGNFIGQAYEDYREILHPTTFYDLGIRDEFLSEICTDVRTDPTCSVIRDITTTSYQDPANIVEHAINYRLDTTKSKFDVDDFFSKTHLGSNIKIFDGDITQLMSVNCEAGIEAFDLDSPHYTMYNGENMDPEDDYFDTYFKIGNLYGPTPIDFKLDFNGAYMRLCLNYRLGDYSQAVPFYLWEKFGQGFGQFGTHSDDQKWDKQHIASMPLQRILSISGVTESTVYDPVYQRYGKTNYLMPDGEEEYILKPMTVNHRTFSITGATEDMLERFEVITRYPDIPPPFDDFPNATQYVEGDLWLQVVDPLTDPEYRKDPRIGYIFVVVNKVWTLQPELYEDDYRETFVPQTALNYYGEDNNAKQVLSTPFLFYFGLKPGRSALDLLIKYYGPKDVFTPEENIECGASDLDITPGPIPPGILIYFRLRRCIDNNANFYGTSATGGFLAMGTGVWGSPVCDVNQAYIIINLTINEDEYISQGYQNVGPLTVSEYAPCYDCTGSPIGNITPTPTPTPVWYFRLSRCIDNDPNYYAKSLLGNYLSSGDGVWGAVNCDPNYAYVVIGSTLDESIYINAGYRDIDRVSLSQFGACRDCNNDPITPPPPQPEWTTVTLVRNEGNIDPGGSTCGNYPYNANHIITGYIQESEVVPGTGGYTVYLDQNWQEYFTPSGLKWGILYNNNPIVAWTVWIGSLGPGVLSDWEQCVAPPDAPTQLIENLNIVNSDLNWTGYNIPHTTKTYTAFQNNYIRSVNVAGYMLQAGDDYQASTINNLDEARIVGNWLNWEGVQTGSIITHGLFVGYNINQTISWNFLQNCPYGIIFKSGAYGSPNMNITSGGASYNIVRGGRFAGRSKGINGARFYNNTFYGNAANWYLLLINENSDGEPTYPGEPSINTKVKNNIFYTTSKTFSISIDTGSLTGFECDYNLYWCEAGDNTPIFAIDGTTYTWAEWRALGYDAHSVVANPNFNQVVTGSGFAPALKSTIQIGTNLGSEFTWGLQRTADWAPGVGPANISQNGTWQVGAKIFP